MTCVPEALKEIEQVECMLIVTRNKLPRKLDDVE